MADELSRAVLTFISDKQGQADANRVANYINLDINRTAELLSKLHKENLIAQGSQKPQKWKLTMAGKLVINSEKQNRSWNEPSAVICKIASQESMDINNENGSSQAFYANGADLGPANEGLIMTESLVRPGPWPSERSAALPTPHNPTEQKIIEFLSSKHPQMTSQITKNLHFKKKETNRILYSMEKRGLLCRVQESPPMWDTIRNASVSQCRTASRTTSLGLNHPVRFRHENLVMEMQYPKNQSAFGQNKESSMAFHSGNQNMKPACSLASPSAQLKNPFNILKDFKTCGIPLGIGRGRTPVSKACVTSYRREETSSSEPFHPPPDPKVLLQRDPLFMSGSQCYRDETVKEPEKIGFGLAPGSHPANASRIHAENRERFPIQSSANTKECLRPCHVDSFFTDDRNHTDEVLNQTSANGGVMADVTAVKTQTITKSDLIPLQVKLEKSLNIQRGHAVNTLFKPLQPQVGSPPVNSDFTLKLPVPLKAQSSSTVPKAPGELLGLSAAEHEVLIRATKPLSLAPSSGGRPDVPLVVSKVAAPLSNDSFAALNKNSISALMEYTQARKLSATIDVLGQSGPPHNPR